MTREVLTARVGLSRNYDGLVQMTDAYDDALTRLRETPGLDAEETRAIDVLSARARRQEDLIERFKSSNALLQNSFAYFGLFSDKLAESDQRSLVTAASALAAAHAAPDARYVGRRGAPGPGSIGRAGASANAAAGHGFGPRVADARADAA